MTDDHNTDPSVVDKLKDKLTMTDDNDTDPTDSTDPADDGDAIAPDDATVTDNRRTDTLPEGLGLSEGGYDAASVGEVKDATERALSDGDMDSDDLAHLAAYEAAHKDRVTLLNWLGSTDASDYHGDDAVAQDTNAEAHAEAEGTVETRDDTPDADADADAEAEADTGADVNTGQTNAEVHDTDDAEATTDAEAEGTTDVDTREVDAESHDFSEGTNGDRDPDAVEPGHAPQGGQQSRDVDADPNAVREVAERREQTTQQAQQDAPTTAGDHQTRTAQQNAATREDTAALDDTQPHDPNASEPQGRESDDAAHRDLQASRSAQAGSGAHAESERNTVTEPTSDPNDSTVVAVESRRTGYIGGLWFDDPDTITVEWNPRIEQAVREGLLHLRTARDESVIPDDIRIGQRQTSAEAQRDQQAAQNDSRPRRSERDRARGQDRAEEVRARNAERQAANRERERRPADAETESDDQYVNQPRDDVGYDETDDER